ncbi:hypothetical protein Q5752_003925 [Cryptotrichosporon argae]
MSPSVFQPVAGCPELVAHTSAVPPSGSATARVGSASLAVDAAADAAVEYRVHAHRRTRRGRLVRADGWGASDLVFLLAMLFVGVGVPRPWAWAAPLGLAGWAWHKCGTVLYESATAMPSLGLQLSTTRGLSLPLHPLLPLALPLALPLLAHEHGGARLLVSLRTTSRFVPLAQIRGVVINEALTRWRVGYYLAVVAEGEIIVVFDHIRPKLAVLREVYHGLHEALFDDYAPAARPASPAEAHMTAGPVVKKQDERGRDAETVAGAEGEAADGRALPRRRRRGQS